MELDSDDDSTPRLFLLSRYQDGVEVGVGDDKEEIMDIVMHYRHLVSQRLKAKPHSLPMSHFAGPVGSILFHFRADFPEGELPLAGGIDEFEFEGYQYRFGLDEARTVATINLAEHLHGLDMCKPFMCVSSECYDQCAALDENLIMAPHSAFFVRSGMAADSNPLQIRTRNAGWLGDDLTTLGVALADGTEAPADVTRAVRIIPSEYLVEQPQRAKFLKSKGRFFSNRTLWEIMPAPTDASQLDMHLAQLSSLDARYVLRFTSEIRHMFDDLTQEKPGSDYDEEGEDSYVESALVPGLQQRDFNRVIDTKVALSGLTLDAATEERMRLILAP